MKPTLNEIDLERLAIALYLDSCRVSPTVEVYDPDDNSPDHPPSPRWTELGKNIRQAYRQAALDLIEEQRHG